MDALATEAGFLQANAVIGSASPASLARLLTAPAGRPDRP